MSTLARNSDPNTSHAAAARVTFAHIHHGVILNVLKSYPLGLGAWQIATLLGWATNNPVCRRLPEMEKLNLVVATDRLVRTPSNRHERVWVAI